jgi:hypothetical protein
MTTILIKKKDTAGAPAPGDLTNAAGGTEIAVNTATKRIYTKDSGGTVVELGTNSTSSTIDQLTVTTSATLSYGTANQVQYLNASKILTGSANLTFNGTTLTANTIGAYTLSGTIAGGGNQINNVIIGTSTPLAGAFTTLSATGVATFSAGTVSLPAITTTGDTNTGIYFPASDTIAFTEGGAEAMRIDSSGNLIVGGNTNAGNARLLSENTSGNQFGLRYSGIATWYNSIDSSGNYIWNKDGTEYLRISSTGLVGIGTSSPNNILTVQGDASTSVAFADNGVGQLIIRGNTDTTKRLALGIDTTNNIGVIQAQKYGTAYYNLTLNPSGGDVGIGTASPAAKLQVNAATDTIKTYGSSYNQQIYDAVTAAFSQAVWQVNAVSYALVGAGGGNMLLNTAGNSTANIIFSTGSGTTERMRIDSNGRLGVGITSPQSLIQVTGSNTYAGAGILLGSAGVASGYLWTTDNLYIKPNTTAGTTSGILSIVNFSDVSKFTFDTSTGYAGIGTSSPAYSLDVFGAAGNSVVASFRSGEVTAAQRAGAGFQTIGNATATSRAARMWLDADGGDFGGSDYFYINKGGNSGIVQLIQQSNAAMTFETNGVEKMRIDAAGLVGIGTSAPYTRLHVLGTIKTAPTNQSGVVAFGGTTDATTQLGIFRGAANSTSDGNFLNIAGYEGLTFSVSAANIGSQTERMRIDNNGNLLVNTTSTGAYFDGKITAYSPDTYAPYCGKQGQSAAAVNVAWNAGTTGDNVFEYFLTETSPTIRGSITYNRAGGLVAYNVTSDYRAKEIKGAITNSGEIIDSVPVYMGKMKDATQERPMFIAHETPSYAHTGEKDAVDKDGKPVYQQMDASSLIPVMWAEIQSLRQRIATLENK